MKVIILAAGKGTRLKPITDIIPKPLIQICGISIIDRIFDSLPPEIDEVVMVVDYLKDKIKSHVGEKFYNKPVIYVDQGNKKGTFGALSYVKNLILENERFLVLNGDDIHTKEELRTYLQNSRSFGAQKRIMSGYKYIRLNKKNEVEGLYPQTEKEIDVLIPTGAYVLDSNIFKHPGVMIAGGEYGLPQTILEQKNEYPIKAVITEHWLPINSFEDIEKAENYFKKIA